MNIDQLVENLRVLGSDDQTVEVREGVDKAILESLSAFANTGGGVIIVGLSEEKGFQRVPDFDAQAAADQLLERGLQLSPPVRPALQIVPFEGGELLVAQIDAFPSWDRPAYISERGIYGGSYQRLGDADVRLTQYEVDRIREEQKQPRWDEAPVEQSGLEQLNAQALKAFLDKQRAIRPGTFAEDEQVAMKRLRILHEDRLTLAALLTLGDYPQEFFPRLTVAFSVFSGTSKGEIGSGLCLLDRKTLSGAIPELVESTVELVRNQMRGGARVGDVCRPDRPDYPLVAVREAVVNALMHRDYSPRARGRQVQVNMFVDRLEVTSPGGLYGTATVQTLGSAGISYMRNQRLATLLEAVEFPGGGLVAEGRGRGLAVIEKSLAENLQPRPEIRADLNSFTIVFFRRRVAQGERSLSADEKVRQAFGQNGSFSTAELMLKTGLSRTAVQRAINKLIAKNTIEATEAPRSPRQRYRVV
ncbi:MAG: ATP-binding protein [Bacillota bacterium]|nr:ATP-binding protein [Bacillota bacterium]